MSQEGSPPQRNRVSIFRESRAKKGANNSHIRQQLSILSPGPAAIDAKFLALKQEHVSLLIAGERPGPGLEVAFIMYSIERLKFLCWIRS